MRSDERLKTHRSSPPEHAAELQRGEEYGTAETRLVWDWEGSVLIVAFTPKKKSGGARAREVLGDDVYYPQEALFTRTRTEHTDIHHADTRRPSARMHICAPDAPLVQPSKGSISGEKGCVGQRLRHGGPAATLQVRVLARSVWSVFLRV